MSKISSTFRVLEILKNLDEGKSLNVKNLANRYETSIRSIQRDFELIKKIYGDILISPQKGEYKAVSKILLKNTLNSTELYMLKNILSLSEKSRLDLSQNVDENVKMAILKEDNSSPYIFKQKPYEEIFIHSQKFKKLEHAVKFCKEIKITYDNFGKISIFVLRPYKIVFINENFYLASETSEQKFILNRIALIKKIEPTKRNFTINYDLMDFILNLQSPWATYQPNYKNYLKEVVLKVAKKQAKYFKLKKFLPSQKIISEDKKGNILVSFKVASELEVIGLIKQWIPFIKVISPESLVKTFENIAKRFYKINSKSNSDKIL